MSSVGHKVNEEKNAAKNPIFITNKQITDYFVEIKVSEWTDRPMRCQWASVSDFVSHDTPFADRNHRHRTAQNSRPH